MVKSGNGKLSYRALQEYSRMRNTLFISTKILLTLNTKVMLIQIEQDMRQFALRYDVINLLDVYIYI